MSGEDAVDSVAALEQAEASTTSKLIARGGRSLIGGDRAYP